MTPCSSIPKIHLLHDGELPADEIAELRAHLVGCAECTAELAELQSITPAFAQLHAHTRLSMIERARLDQRVDRETENNGSQWVELYRTARMLSAIAASILIISSIWLIEIPSGHTTAVSPAVVVLSPRDVSSNTTSDNMRVAAETPAWERIAENLRVDPRPEDGGAFDIGVADARRFGDNSLDGHVADWIIAGLDAGSIGTGINGGSGHAAP